MELIDQALRESRFTLSEFESKQLLAAYGVPITREVLISDRGELSGAIREIGFPLVLKGCSPEISHKTESGVIHVDIRSESEAEAALDEILSRMPKDRPAVLVQEMVKGERELMVGLTRDPQFGPCVMFGLGGIFTEILEDVSFRMAPLTASDAMSMMRDIRGNKILQAVRGMPAVDTDRMAEILVNIGRMGMDLERIKEVDVNPLKIRNGQPVAVDALVVLR
jgi:acetate---CoA ligase (ADP-forming) subunit beta